MKHLSMLIIFAGVMAGGNVLADDDMSQDEMWRCMDLGDSLMRAEERLKVGERTIKNIDRRIRETTDRNFQRELTREYNKLVRKQNRRLDDYEGYQLPRFNKECARRYVQLTDYERVCNTRDRLKNPFCRSYPDFVKIVKRKKDW